MDQPQLPFVKKMIALGVAIDIIIADQISKWAITELFLRPKATGENPTSLVLWLTEAPEKVPPVQIQINSFFNLVMVWNQGVSFGLFNHDSAAGPMILVGLSLLITGLFLIWLLRSAFMVQAMAIALVIGGAIGNVIDRLRFGAVIDFLDFHAFGYHWPAFNIADSCIVIGIAILILHSLLLEKKAGK